MRHSDSSTLRIPAFLLDVFLQSKPPVESLAQLELPVDEERRVLELRRKYSGKQYADILAAADGSDKDDPHTLVYAAMSNRDQEGDLVKNIAYLYRALQNIGSVSHPYLQAAILNQIAMDTFEVTKRFALCKTIAAEAILAAPDGSFRCWAAWTTLAELIILEGIAESADMNEVNSAVDIIMRHMQDSYPTWAKDDDLKRYLQRQSQLAPYRESDFFRHRFPALAL